MVGFANSRLGRVLSLLTGLFLVAGCTTSSVSRLAGSGTPSGSGGLVAPGCSLKVAKAAALTSVITSTQSLSGPPFGVAVTPDGAWSFVVVRASVVVMSNGTRQPRAVHVVALPLATEAAGERLSPDGTKLFVAAGTGAAVVDVAKAEQGAADAVLGVLSDGLSGQGAGAIEVSVTPDGAFAFVSLEFADEIAVFDLRAGYGTAGYKGLIHVDQTVVGTAVSADGKWLLATSEGAPEAGGTLSVIDVAKAEAADPKALTATTAAGCSPVRVVISPDGAVAWVTARESNALLGFSMSALTGRDAAHALIADVPVGQSPVGLAIVEQGRRIIVADSDRFNTPGASAGLDLVDPAAALARKPALLGSIAAGDFPREMSAVPGKQTLLVANFSSGQLETVDLSTLP